MARYSSGWIKLWRSVDQHWIGEDGFALAIWTKLMLWAAREPSTTILDGELIPVVPGQVVTSLRDLSDKLGFHKQVVERRLDRLEADNSIVQRKGHGGRIITVCNWEEYQRREDGDGTPKGHDVGREEVRHVGHDVGRRVPHIEKQEGKKEEERTLSLVPKREKVRLTQWSETDQLAKVFENLKAFPAYWRIFDLEHERKTLLGHQERHKLTIADLEQITWELRNWVDGPNGAKVKSPRGTLATFIANFVGRKTPPVAATPPKKSKIPWVTAEDFA